MGLGKTGSSSSLSWLTSADVSTQEWLGKEDIILASSRRAENLAANQQQRLLPPCMHDAHTNTESPKHTCSKRHISRWDHRWTRARTQWLKKWAGKGQIASRPGRARAIARSCLLPVTDWAQFTHQYHIGVHPWIPSMGNWIMPGSWPLACLPGWLNNWHRG